MKNEKMDVQEFVFVVRMIYKSHAEMFYFDGMRFNAFEFLFVTFEDVETINKERIKKKNEQKRKIREE